MRIILLTGLLGLAALTTFAQNLSRGALEASYFHVNEETLLDGKKYDLVELRIAPSGRDIDSLSYPELDHWALLISRQPEYQIQIVVNGSTLDDANTALSKTQDIAEKIRSRFLKWDVPKHQYHLLPLGSEDPLNTQPSIDSILKKTWKPLAHEMNARAFVVVTKIVP